MKTEQIEKEIAQNLILTALKEAYFKRVKKEKLGATPVLTAEIELLEIAIKELIQTIKENEKN
ncbi:MAG: hypothetical protein ACK5H0_10305 [Bacteroidota bacterium]|jgi:hypothetical protein